MCIRDSFNNFDLKQDRLLQQFLEELKEQKFDFVNQQTQANQSFQSSLNERTIAFESQINNCETIAQNQRTLYSQQESLLQNYLQTNQSARQLACQQRSNQTYAAFIAQQAADLLLFEKEQSKQLQNYNDQQTEKRNNRIANLTREFSQEKIVFTTYTLSLIHI